jgi:hypothetical protein
VYRGRREECACGREWRHRRDHRKCPRRQRQ